MRFFKRGDAEPQGGDFWAWWAGARDRVAQAIGTSGFDEKLIGEISKTVAQVDPRLACRRGGSRSPSSRTRAGSSSASSEFDDPAFDSPSGPQ